MRRKKEISAKCLWAPQAADELRSEHIRRGQMLCCAQAPQPSKRKCIGSSMALSEQQQISVLPQNGMAHAWKRGHTCAQKLQQNSGATRGRVAT